MNAEFLIKENMNLIYKISQSFYGVEQEDLIQAGITGILKAYSRYKDDKSTKFSTYAYFDIYGEMYELANKKMIKVNKDTLKMYKIIEKTRYSEAQRLGKIPTNEELSVILNMPKETIDFACMSASVILSTDEESATDRSLYETVSEEIRVTNDDRIMLKDSLENLTIDEKNVIESRYYEDLTQSDTARNLNMSQVMVSRLEKKGIEKMRNYISL